MLHHYNSYGPLYPLFTCPAKSLTPQAFLSLKVSSLLLHRKLAHLGSSILSKFLSSNSNLCSFHRLDFHCNACQLGKYIKLSFLDSINNATCPLSIIHSNIWQSLVSSFFGYHYYVLFLDDYTQYWWVYPLKHKSEVFEKFVKFTKEVENQFLVSIKQF